MTGDALEQALALQGSPILRFSVRDRPLAPTIGVVIQLAAASQPLLQDTASSTGMDEGKLLEAARFYLQQVLFEGERDAYRTLAATPATPTDEIREHYRWLQRWLHPDRRGDEWESQFASRVNWAWSNLRTEAARESYDAGLAARAGAAAARGVHGGMTAMPVGGWKAVPVPMAPTPHRLLKRFALSLSFLSCCGLLYLAIVRQELPNPVPPLAQSGDIAATSAPAATVASAPMVAVAATRSSLGTAAAEPLAMTERAIGAAGRSGTAAPVADPVADPDEHVAVAVTPEVSSAAAPVLHQDTPVVVIAQATRLAAATPVAIDEAVASPPRRGDRQRTPPLPLMQATVTNAQQPRRRPENTPPPPGPALTTAAPDASAETALAAQAPPVVAPATDPSGDRRVARPASAIADDGAQDAPVAPSDLLARMGLARQQVRDLVAYFRRVDGAGPGWPDAHAPFNARQSRHALRQRTGLTVAAQFALDPPQWQVSGQRAALEAGYRVASNSQPVERGLFRVDMIWHDNGWRLTRVQLEPER